MVYLLMKISWPCLEIVLKHQLRAAVRSALDDICPFLGSTNRCRILFAMFACDLAGSSLKQTAPVCQSHCYLSISRVSALLPPLCHYAEPNKWEIVYIYTLYVYHYMIWHVLGGLGSQVLVDLGRTWKPPLLPRVALPLGCSTNCGSRDSTTIHHSISIHDITVLSIVQ